MGLFSKPAKGDPQNAYEEYLDVYVEMIQNADNPERWEALNERAKALKAEGTRNTDEGRQYYCGLVDVWNTQPGIGEDRPRGLLGRLFG